MAGGCLRSPSVTPRIWDSQPWHSHPAPGTPLPGQGGDRQRSLHYQPWCLSFSSVQKMPEPNLGQPGKIWDYINSLMAEAEG